MKKIASVCLTLALLLCFVPVCLAAGTAYTVKDLNMSLQVPEGFYTFDQTTMPDNPDLEKAKMDDWYGALKEMQKNGILLVMKSPDSISITVSKKDTSTTQELYNLAQVSEEKFNELLTNFENTGDPNITCKAGRYGSGPIPFIKSEITGTANGKQIWEISYVTIVNGVSINIDTYSEQEITEQQKAWVQSVTDSVVFNEIKEKPVSQPETMDWGSLLSLAVPAAALVLIIGVPLTVMSVSRKKERRRKEQLGEKLAVYRRQQLEQEKHAAQSGQPAEEARALFQNRTECNTAAVQSYSNFTYLRKQWGAVVSFILAAVLCLSCAVLYNDANILLRLLLAAAGVYLIVRVCTMPGKLFRSEERVYAKSRSRTAVYTFREEDFRVSGTQSSSVYPYFQITAAYETKNFFYLYFGAQRAYLVSKEGFEHGDENVKLFRTFLRGKLGNAFKGGQ